MRFRRKCLDANGMGGRPASFVTGREALVGLDGVIAGLIDDRL